MVNSEMIKKRMREMNLTQRDVAERLNIAAPTVSQKINGIRPLNLDEAQSIAELLEINNSEFGLYFFAR